MTHYDHAVAMAIRLEIWRDEQVPSNIELEILAAEQRIAKKIDSKPTTVQRIISWCRSIRFRDALDTP